MEQPWNVLVLEDDEHLRTALMMALEDEGFEVAGAEIGEVALQAARRERFDLVICDVRMAGPDGLDTLASLRQMQPALRAIVITGYADDSAPRRALSCHVDDYLHKPFGVPQLLEAIRRLREEEADERRYVSLVGRVVSGYRQLLRRSNLNNLDAARHEAYQDFYVGIRSGKLIQAEAIQIWDRLEALDVRLDRLKPAFSRDEAQALLQDYRYICELVSALERASLTPRPRHPSLLAAPEFNSLFRRVKAGEIGLEKLKTASYLRWADPLQLSTNPELRLLHEEVWRPREALA